MFVFVAVITLICSGTLIDGGAQRHLFCRLQQNLGESMLLGKFLALGGQLRNGRMSSQPVIISNGPWFGIPIILTLDN